MPSLEGSREAKNVDLARLVHAANDTRPIAGLTHTFYRYPARFSPNFARAAILEFSKPGDWVLDPFVGGGTTLVESLANGRNAIGVDISELAVFVCEAKTQYMGHDDIKTINSWMQRLPDTINIHRPSRRSPDYAAAGYYRHLDHKKYWRLRKAIEQVLESIERLRREPARKLARCILLRTAQWALDGRKTLPTIKAFRGEIVKQAKSMIAASEDFRGQLRAANMSANPHSICLQRSTVGLENDPCLRQTPPPKLVLTSPPYPGIHVLYHRWQVDGRKESPAPFWIASRLDGAGSSYYTMGDRKYPELRTYFDNLRASFSSVTQLCSAETTIVQMVAFSDPDWQLPRYLEVMEECGLQEVLPWELDGPEGDCRLWRQVPNRKWHAHQKDNAPGSREVVLVHRKT